MSDTVKSANITLRDDLLEEFIAQANLIKLKTVEGYWRENVINYSDYDFQNIVILKLKVKACSLIKNNAV